MGLNSRAARFGAALALVAAFVYLNNTSWLAPEPRGGPTLIAHRGVHQTFNRENLGRDDCTATRIYPPEHDYQENTLASIEAAFAQGADIVEIDIHPTSDGEIAVFHDWTVDCRTDGSGTTRDLSMAYLKTLDIGYGYTHDGGVTFPFRGRGVGLIPTLEEVYRTFPGRDFLVNIKSNDPTEANRLDTYLRERGLQIGSRLMAYGGERPIDRLRQLRPDALLFSKPGVKRCALRYLLLGWSGYVPGDCRNSVVIVPDTWQWAAWGWPHRLSRRMENAGSLVLAMDFSDVPKPMHGVYRPEDLDFVPEDYSGALWVEKIEVIGPYLKSRK